MPVVDTLIGGQELRELRPGELIERLPLPAGSQQLLLVGLAMHRHQVIGEVREQRHRHRTATRGRTRPAFRADRPHQDQGAAVVVEVAPRVVDLAGDRTARLDPKPAFDNSAVGARPDPRRVGPAAEEQAESGHHHGLAGASLPGHDVESRRQLKHCLVDHPETGDPHFLKHGRLAPRLPCVP